MSLGSLTVLWATRTCSSVGSPRCRSLCAARRRGREERGHEMPTKEVHLAVIALLALVSSHLAQKSSGPSVQASAAESAAPLVSLHFTL